MSERCREFAFNFSVTDFFGSLQTDIGVKYMTASDFRHYTRGKLPGPLHIRDRPVLSSQCEVTRGRDLHEYNTSGGVRLDTRSTGFIQAYEALPSEVGTRLFKKLPLELRVEPLFERKIRRLLVQAAYYSLCW
ncbi:hypothetical protein J6590_001058 [Homalodisca vitripennis]|nr:hypothetical protein J6590_001058 [Homalodisca vitripennis]